jgi:metal-responsive CopG/Arc/MetJ family transcriptional regulator
VDVAGRAVRIKVSLDEGLLCRIDEIAKRAGLSRPALLAKGAHMAIATEAGS